MSRIQIYFMRLVLFLFLAVGKGIMDTVVYIPTDGDKRIPAALLLIPEAGRHHNQRHEARVNSSRVRQLNSP